MTEKFNEEITEYFDPMLAEELSIAVHTGCGDCCPHDIGIKLAKISHEFYGREEAGVEVDG